MRERTVLLAASITLGLYSLLSIPIYWLVRFHRFSILRGETSLLVLAFLVVVPLLLRFERRAALSVVLVLNVLLLLLDWSDIGFAPFGSPRSFSRPSWCSIVRGNCLDHNLFHLSHVPFYLVMVAVSLLALRRTTAT